MANSRISERVSSKGEYSQLVVWITGAGTGIGKALALELAARGATLYLSGRTADTLEEAAEACKSRGATKVQPLICDVTKSEDCTSAVHQILEQEGALDMLFANAGTYWKTPAVDFDVEGHHKMMAVNYGGVINAVGAALPAIEAAKGTLLLMASVVGYRGFPLSSAYGASKAAVIHFSESIRFELEPKGIRVTVVNPGFVKTPLTEQNEFEMPCVITEEEAGRAIMSGLESGQREIHFPKAFSWSLKALRVIPLGVYHWLVSRKVPA